ncbi:MAG: hypothetical protein RR908_05975, partial [Rikenellaceae bacterium]
TDAGYALNVFPQNIGCCCNGKYKQASGYLWRYSKEVIPGNNIESVKVTYMKNKKIYQYDLNGNYIRTWDKQRDFLDSIGVKGRVKLSECLKGTRDNAYGYIWSYEQTEIQSIVEEDNLYA